MQLLDSSPEHSPTHKGKMKRSPKRAHTSLPALRSSERRARPKTFSAKALVQWSLDTDDSDAEDQPFFVADADADKEPSVADEAESEKAAFVDDEIEADASSSSTGKSMMSALPTSWSTAGVSRSDIMPVAVVVFVL